MIIYRPDGMPFETSILSKPRHCFLITRLGTPIPEEALQIRKEIIKICHSQKYKVIDASAEVTGHDFLLKIWKLIAASPLSVGICHAKFPTPTQMNIYYELAVARTMGKETIIVKSSKAKQPSDLVRDEYIEFNDAFSEKFLCYLQHVDQQAEYYETMANQLEGNPLLAIDYLRRAFLITGNMQLRKKAKDLRDTSGLNGRAKNSVEMLAASF